MSFEQYTGRMKAKSMEDTAFYRYERLRSHNRVGGEPTRFGTQLDEFHAVNLEHAAARPHTMNATSTHDTKRGEDARGRVEHEARGGEAGIGQPKPVARRCRGVAASR